MLMSIDAGDIVIVLGILGTGEKPIKSGIVGMFSKLISLGMIIGGDISMVDGTTIGPKGPISKHGKTMGGSCNSCSIGTDTFS